MNKTKNPPLDKYLSSGECPGYPCPKCKTELKVPDPCLTSCMQGPGSLKCIRRHKPKVSCGVSKLIISGETILFCIENVECSKCERDKRYRITTDLECDKCHFVYRINLPLHWAPRLGSGSCLQKGGPIGFSQRRNLIISLDDDDYDKEDAKEEENQV